MSKLKLHHHVYTSIGGYKTVYVSPELDRRVVRALEAFSDTLYPRVGQQTLRSLFHPSPTHVCISRIFRSSADHAGRRRSCVHNILFTKSDLFDLRYVSPFSFPGSIFLATAPEATQVPSLGRRLKTELELGEPSISDLKVDAGRLSGAIGKSVFSAIMSNHDMAVIAPKFDCYEFLASAGDMLPPFLRFSTSVVSGTVYRSRFAEGATLYSLSPKYDTAKLRSEGAITYDATSGTTANLPAPNKYFAFLARHLDEEAEVVRKLVAVVHRYPIARVATNDMYHNLIRAFEQTSHCFLEDGSLDAMSDINALLGNLVAFFQAGYTELVVEALRQAFADLEEKGELSGSTDILGQLETSLEDQQVQPVQKEAAISRLANWLNRAYATP
jgi:hypothetical protein